MIYLGDAERAQSRPTGTVLDTVGKELKHLLHQCGMIRSGQDDIVVLKPVSANSERASVSLMHTSPPPLLLVKQASIVHRDGNVQQRIAECNNRHCGALVM